MSRKTFLILLIAGVAFRVAMLLNFELVNGGDVDVYLADEGIVGLMAMHIREGRALPIFFYGQHYLGALEAYLAALSFSIFGASLLALRATTFAVSLGLLWAVYCFARRAYSVEAARWGTALVAIAPMYFLQWNLKARGGFVEHILLLFILMIGLWRFLYERSRGSWPALLLGLVAGVAFWVNQLVLSYLLVIAAVLAAERLDAKTWRTLLAGFLIGASLLIGYNAVHPLATFRTLARKSITMNRVPAAERDQNWIARGVGKRLEALSNGADKIGMVFGVPPRAGVARLGLSAEARAGDRLTRARQYLALLPLLVFGSAVLALRPRRRAATAGARGVLSLGTWNWREPDSLLFLFVAVTFVVGYVSPRYMLPAYPLAAVIAGALATRSSGRGKRWLVAGVAAVFAYNALSWADLRAATGEGSGERIAKLVRALEEADLTRCYSAGPMYHAVFASGERLILAPLQKDRYPRYGRTVSRAERICYVFRKDQTRKRQHLAFLRLLSGKRVTYRSMDAGTYTVLYDFQPRSAITERDMLRVRRGEGPADQNSEAP